MINFCVQEKQQEDLCVKVSSENLELLSQIRDTSPVSSRSTSKGALVKETYAIFSSVSEGLPLSEIRNTIVQGSVIQKTAYGTRERIWNAIWHRYLSVCPNWVGKSLANSSKQGMYSVEYLSLAYLYFALRDRFVFDFVTEVVWDKWQRQTTAISRSDLLDFLEKQSEKFPNIKRWRESTRVRLASSILAALRDFGLLRGIQKKYIQSLTIESETVYHLLCILLCEGKRGRSLLEAPDWRLFLWSESQVVNALAILAQKGWIRFEKAGKTVILELIRFPEVV